MKKKTTKKVIKWENVIASFYTIITLFKYFITSNPDIPLLLIDLSIDTILGLVIYFTVYFGRKVKRYSDTLE